MPKDRRNRIPTLHPSDCTSYREANGLFQSRWYSDKYWAVKFARDPDDEDDLRRMQLREAECEELAAIRDRLWYPGAKRGAPRVVREVPAAPRPPTERKTRPERPPTVKKVLERPPTRKELLQRQLEAWVPPPLSWD